MCPENFDAPGCYCTEEGYVRDAEGNCIPYEDCGKKFLLKKKFKIF